MRKCVDTPSEWWENRYWNPIIKTKDMGYSVKNVHKEVTYCHVRWLCLALADRLTQETLECMHVAVVDEFLKWSNSECAQ